jgi:hypothetical protein
MKYPIAFVAFFALAGTAFAQNSPPANPSGNTPAVATSKTVNPSAPVKGANSFTESQARSRIVAAGYTNVASLQKDNNGVWHATANRGGSSHDVTVDYQGNVTPK